MSITVNFYSFAKKINSTARPGAPDKTYPCRLKESCGIFNPVIALDMGLSDSPREYNYANIPNFDRYYFVKEWTFEQGLWYATLEEDVLASWKTTIGSSTCYVLRSSIEYDLEIPDNTYPGTNETVFSDVSGVSPWITDSIDNGTYVVGIAGQKTTYYIFDNETLDVFFNYLFSDVYANDLAGDWSIIYPQLKAQTNPLQYITSIMWFPMDLMSGILIDKIRVGWVDVPCVAIKVTGSGIRSGIQSFTIPNHPQIARGKYLNNTPYSSYSLFYPPWGSISLDPDVMANSDELAVIWNVDLRTGQGTLTLSNEDAHIMSWIHSQVGVPYQVSQILNRGFGIGNVLAPLISTGIGLASGNYAGAGASAISGAVGAIGDLTKAKIPSATTIGSNGGINALRGFPRLQCEFKRIPDEDIDHRGRPLCANKRINTLGGYIMVKDADIKIPCTRQEQEAIRTYLEGGFFYE